MSGGTETRKQILPSTEPADTGFVLPNYDFAGNLPTPRSVGVNRGGGFGDVMNAAKGIIYYTDVMGFGASTNRLTQGMPFYKLGINFTMKSGLQCTNGADMYYYFKGIPDGSGLGSTLDNAIKEMGYPPARGLAVGILDDVKEALDGSPLIRSMFGNAYPVCEEKELQVGDDRGLIKDPKTGDQWVQGDVYYKDGRPFQRRWIQKVDDKGKPIFVDRGTYEMTEKTHNPDGTLKTAGTVKEKFNDMGKASLTVAIALFALAFAFARK